MNVLQIITTAVLTTIIVILLGVVSVWSMWPKTAEAGVAVAAHSVSWHNSTDHCRHLSPDHLKLGEAVVTVALDLDDIQQEALLPIRNSLENWRSQVERLCTSVDHESLDFDTGLASLEQILSISAATVAERATPTKRLCVEP